jgi:hypothetical protein
MDIPAPQRLSLPVGMTRADALCIGLVIFLQLGTMVTMGVVWSDWKGWSQESRSSKSWMVFGSIQTVVAVVGLTIIYRDWLAYKNKQ